MNFPTIRHIDDVLPSIAGRSDFVVAKKDGYTVVDYVYALPDSFDDPIRAECRGITFDSDGKIIRRPLHKFKNLGETAELQPHLIDFSLPHVITEKRDGSMIAPAMVDGEVLLMTRMGHTDVAKKAERLLTDNFDDALRNSLRYGWTPIFEFTAPNNRIVIQYDRAELTLLTVRDMVTGEYFSPAELEITANDFGVPFVRHFASDWNSASAFLDYARAIRDAEGFVVRFDSGLWLKAKGDDYVLKHKAKDSVLREKNLLQMVLLGQVDDVLPLLEDADRTAVERYRGEVLRGIAGTASRVRTIVEAGRDLDQKTFAVEFLADVGPEMRPLIFSVRSGRNSIDVVTAFLLKKAGSQPDVDEARWVHGASWDVFAGPE